MSNANNSSGDSTNRKYGRNRTFCSKTSNFYRNKLAEIGIEKDLREILERKRLQKEHNELVENGTIINNSLEQVPESSKKVNFESEKHTIRRSKSFNHTEKHQKKSGPNINSENNNLSVSVENLEQSGTFQVKREPRKNRSNYRGKKSYVDLKHPTNIKVELNLNSGDRKCMIENDNPIEGVKCNFRNSRKILKNNNMVVSQSDRKPHVQQKCKDGDGQYELEPLIDESSPGNSTNIHLNKKYFQGKSKNRNNYQKKENNAKTNGKQ